jgi:hypothetical protein
VRKQLGVLAAALLVSSGAASAQQHTPQQYESSGPRMASQSTTPDRPPAATMPESNAPFPQTTGDAPAASEKIDPEMDSVGGQRPAPGEEKK